MTKLKIILLVRDLRPGGVPSTVGPIGKEFLKHGHDVVIYNLGLASEVIVNEMDDLHVISAGRPDKSGYRGHLSIFWKWIRFVKEYSPDVIQSHVGLPDIYLALSPVPKKTIKIRAALAPNLFPAQPLFGFFFERFISPWAFKHHVAVSEGVAHELQKTGISRKDISLILNPVSKRILNAMNQPFPSRPSKLEWIQPDSIRIGYLGRLSPEKGPDRLIHWYAQLKEVFESKSQLILAGSGAMETDLKTLVIRLGLKKEVLFLGYVKNPEEILPHFHVVISPSRYEGLPIALIEAASLGCPIVATETDGAKGLQELTQDFLIIPNDDELPLAHLKNLAQWIQTKTITKGRSPNLTKEAMTKIRPESVAHEYLNLYQRCLIKEA